MSRRSLLLAYLANSFKWLPYSYEYLYNSLIPETISGKGVKNKAKVSKIYANGVVENQLLRARNQTTTSNGLTYVYSEDGSLTITGTATAYSYLYLGINNSDYIPYTANHTYLCYVNLSGTITGSYRFSFLDISSSGNQQRLVKPTSSGTGRSYVAFETGCVVNITIKPAITDLTLREGAGNEPTTLTDNRVQAILNRGYIAYNTGTYKSTDISEFSSEPYNLFDGELTRGNISSSTGQADQTGNNIRSSNYIKVNNGSSLNIEWDRPSCNTAVNGFCYLYIYQYDENYNYLNSETSINIASYNLTLLSNTKYIRFKIYSNNLPAYQNLTSEIVKLCIHIQGTRTGYAPHQTFSPLSFIYQGNGALNSHDTFEITSTEYVFTKELVKVDLSTITFNYQSGNTNIFGQYLQVSNNYAYYKGGIDYTSLANSILIGYTQVMPTGDLTSMPDKSFMIRKVSNTYTALCIIRDDTYNNNVEGFRTFIKNQEMWCELNTPQVIRIPKKHLGIVKIRDLSWSYQSTDKVFYTKVSSKAIDNTNIYCSLYVNGTWNKNNTISSDNYAGGTKNEINIHDERFTSVSDMLNSIGDYYIFFETQNEVPDIADTIGIEKGGTITSNSQVLPNVDFKIKCK